jgi:hypothetical protein
MNLFEIVNDNFKNQEEELSEQEQEKTKKAPKLNIYEVLERIAQKDYGWIGRNDNNYNVEDKIKGIQPFIVILFLSKIWNSKNRTSRLTDLDIGYFYLLEEFNNKLNTNVFTTSKEMFWLLACSINPFELQKFDALPIKSKKNTSTKYNEKVIEILSKELLTSKQKIKDLIDNNLIDVDLMKKIEKDLKTLEGNKK